MKSVIIKVVSGEKSEECDVRLEGTPLQQAIQVCESAQAFGRWCCELWEVDSVMASPLVNGEPLIWREVRHAFDA